MARVGRGAHPEPIRLLGYHMALLVAGITATVINLTAQIRLELLEMGGMHMAR